MRVLVILFLFVWNSDVRNTCYLVMVNTEKIILPRSNQIQIQYTYYERTRISVAPSAPCSSLDTGRVGPTVRDSQQSEVWSFNMKRFCYHLLAAVVCGFSCIQWQPIYGSRKVFVEATHFRLPWILYSGSLIFPPMKNFELRIG